MIPIRRSFPERDRADAPEALDRKGVQELQLAVRRYDQEAVGLGHPARDFGEELRPGHADRDREADVLEDVAPEAGGDLRGRARDPLHAADVEKGLVDREPLHHRRRVLEHPVHGLAGLGVGGHAG